MVVTIAERIHLFPSRTQKLSSLTPKVLGLDPGRIGSCHLLLPLSSVGRTIVQVCAVRSPFDEEPSEVKDSQRQTQDVVVVELNDHNI